MRSPLALALVAVGLLLASGVVASAAIATRGLAAARLAAVSRLEVTGSAERLVRSDRVKWVATFGTTAPVDGLGEGYRRLADGLEAARGVLAEHGFGEGDVELASIEVYGIYRECYGAEASCVRELVSYELRQRFTLNSSRVDDVTALAQDALLFTEAGVDLIPLSLEYYTSQLAELRPELLADATRDAQLRARAVAESTGVELGPLQAVDSGVFQVTQVNSTDVSALGEYDTSAIDKKISAVVRATFGLR